MTWKFLPTLLSRIREALQLARELNRYTDIELAELGITREQVVGITLRGAFPKAAPPQSRQVAPAKWVEAL